MVAQGPCLGRGGGGAEKGGLICQPSVKVTSLSPGVLVCEMETLTFPLGLG